MFSRLDNPSSNFEYLFESKVFSECGRPLVSDWVLSQDQGKIILERENTLPISHSSYTSHKSKLCLIYAKICIFTINTPIFERPGAVLICSPCSCIGLGEGL
jgi:hypothetical protein